MNPPPPFDPWASGPFKKCASCRGEIVAGGCADCRALVARTQREWCKTYLGYARTALESKDAKKALGFLQSAFLKADGDVRVVIIAAMEIPRHRLPLVEVAMRMCGEA